MDLNLIWLILFGVLIIGYAVLDGFDLGVGVLHFLAKNDHERRLNVNSIAPVWDGNEVWLLTAGGALFAAFPKAYATIFSSFYLALVLVLVALIFRAVSMEFRSKVDSPGWRKLWDVAFAFGSILPSILFGVAIGNLLRGIPLNENHIYTGNFLGLLNVYALVCGVFSLVTAAMHGGIYLCLKVDGDYQKRIAATVSRLWFGFVILLVTVLIMTFFSAHHVFDGILKKPLFWIAFVSLLGGTVYLPVAMNAKDYRRAFVASATAIAAMFLIGGTGIFPKLLPSTTDLANSLTIYNAASTPRTHKVMLVIALVGMPLVIAYTIVIYRVFKGKTVLDEDSY